MQLNEAEGSDAHLVEGYGPGFFRIGGQVYHGPVLTGHSGTRTWGGFDDTAPLMALIGQVDVVFFGTGADIAHIPAGIRRELESAGIGVEPMNSPSACRTYNVLLNEGRRIAAALIPV